MIAACGRTYYFCSVADQQAFLKRPEQYADK
jgi:YHS domain-containing protein